MMKFFFILSLFLGMRLDGLAQQDYFLLFQSDHNQPFYILIDGKTFSSSETGRVSMGSLKDTVYKITVGFPKDVYPKLNFTISINHKDQSYQLKDLGAEGWALFNTLSMELKMPDKEGEQHIKTVSSGSLKKEDAFARLMAGVVNDTSVMYNSYVEEEPKKEVPVPAKTVVGTPKVETSAIVQNNAPVINHPVTKPQKDSTLAQKPDMAIAKADHVPNNKQAKDSALVHKPASTVAKVDHPIIKKQETAPEPLYRTSPPRKLTSFVKLHAREKTDTSLNLTFVDIPIKGAIDTVDIAIPLEQSIAFLPAPTKEEPKQVVKEIVPESLPWNLDTVANSQHLTSTDKTNSINKAPISDSATKVLAKEEIKKEPDASMVVSTKPVIDSNHSVGNEKQSKDSMKMEQRKVASELMNKDCNYEATVYDIDKLRLKLMELDNEDDRIMMVRKFVKLKCISVKQVNALSEVFKTDEGRYRLLDATYAHVSDIGQFTQLESLLVDPYYINRFRAMIR